MTRATRVTTTRKMATREMKKMTTTKEMMGTKMTGKKMMGKKTTMRRKKMTMSILMRKMTLTARSTIWKMKWRRSGKILVRLRLSLGII
jgi:hypothetical protein